MLRYVEDQIERIVMGRKLSKLQSPRPSVGALLKAWLILRDQLRRGDAAPVSVPMGSLWLHGHNWPDLMDVFRDVWVSDGYVCAIDQQEPFIIDCGANVGAVSLYFKLQYPASRIVAFEPNPACAEVWHRNIEGNGLHGVELVEAACGLTDGHADLYFEEGRTLGSNLEQVPATTGKSRKVPLVRLSRWIDRPVDLLKIDVEGAEHDILNELIESGAIARVRRIMMEYHHMWPHARPRLGGFLGRLEDAGFTYRLSAESAPASHFAPDWQGFMIYAVRDAK